MYTELAIHVDYFITKVNTISKLYVMTYSVEWQRQVVEIMPKCLFMYFDIFSFSSPFPLLYLSVMANCQQPPITITDMISIHDSFTPY